MDEFKKKCQEGIDKAFKSNRPVTFRFNGIYITAGGYSTVPSLMKIYLEKLDENSKI